MSNLIELEASYCVENFEEILKKIKEKTKPYRDLVKDAQENK